MATVTAGNSTSITISGDQTVAISVNHNNTGRFYFAPANASSINGDGGTGASIGPLPMSKTYGPFGIAGTLTISCEIGTVTYTVNDTYFPNNVSIDRTNNAGSLTGLTITNSATGTSYSGLNVNAGSVSSQFFNDAAGTAVVAGAVLRTVSNHPLVFGINSTERMRLDTSGNLGLGVTPSAWAAGWKAVETGNTANGLVNSGVNSTGISANAYNDGAWKYGGTGFANFLSVGNSQTGAFAFYTAASGTAGNAITFTQAMTLNASGNLLVGTAAAYGGPGRINVGFDQTTNFGITLRNTNATATGVFVSFENSGGTGNGSISQTNSTTVAYNTSSDRRLKTNIAPAPEAGTDIDAIAIVSHDWVSNSDHVKYGVVAQDLHAVVPEAVTAGDDGDEIERTWGVDYSKLVPMLIKEIQSLRARVAQLENGN